MGQDESEAVAFRCLTEAEVAVLRSAVVAMSRSGSEPLRDTDGLMDGGAILVNALTRAAEGPLAGADDIFVRTAFLVRGIVQEHAYVNGNKRTGFMAMGASLAANGYSLTASRLAIDQFIIRVAEGLEDLETMAAWIRANAAPA